MSGLCSNLSESEGSELDRRVASAWARRRLPMIRVRLTGPRALAERPTLNQLRLRSFYRRLRRKASNPRNRLFELLLRRRNSCRRNEKALRRSCRRACLKTVGMIGRLLNYSPRPWPRGTAACGGALRGWRRVLLNLVHFGRTSKMSHPAVQQGFGRRVVDVLSVAILGDIVRHFWTIWQVCESVKFARHNDPTR